MDLTILGWVWIGIFIGVIIGIVGTSIKLSKQITDLESELQDSRVEFKNIWRVKSEETYDVEFKSSLQNRQVEWWKDDESYLDIDK